MPRKNAKFRKCTIGNHCWYCDGKSDGIMDFVNGDEIPVCLPCFSKNVHYLRNRKKKEKISDKDIGKISIQTTLAEDSNAATA